MKRLLASMAVALSALAVHAQAAQTAGVEQQIAAMEQKWAQAQQAGDLNAIGSLMADSFTMVIPTGFLLNRSQALDDAKKNHFDSVAITDIKVTSYGTTAIATGIWTAKGTDENGKPLSEHERFVDTWHKMADGKWQCVASGNANLP